VWWVIVLCLFLVSILRFGIGCLWNVLVGGFGVFSADVVGWLVALVIHCYLAC